MLDCAQPGDYCLQEIAVHAASYHLERGKDRNEFNPGLGLKVRPVRDAESTDRWFVAGGFYRNSFYRTSVYVGIGTDVPLAWGAALRFTAMGVTGYSLTVSPVIVPELVLHARGYGVSVAFVPKLKFENHVVEPVVALSLLKKF